ncbi:MAG: transglutaminase-like domain-containing protein [Ignavibacteriales bacterium]
MSKNMKFFGIASLIVIIFLLSAGMVNANGSQNSSSYNGITISVAADVAEGQLTLSGINETDKDVKIKVRKDQAGSVDKWYDVTGKYQITSNIIFEDGEGQYFIYAMIKEDSSEYSYGPTLYVRNIGQTQQEYAGGNTTDELYSENNAFIENINTEDISIDETYTENTYNENTYTENSYSDSIKEVEEEVKEESNKSRVNSDGSFLNPSKDIDSDDSKIISLSNSLTSGKKTDSQKISAIYTWVAENITYDFDKYNHMLAGDYSDKFGSLSALELRKGVCYDMSTLLAALCRAAGIEAKVAKGYSTNIIGYHGWNEVYDADKGEWLILDVTIESLNHSKTGASIEFTVRPSAEYSKTSEM